MPKRDDISSVLILGAGPIVIGQACEFDYSGTQACKALKEEGYRVILVNSNPATIMTDPEMADATYIEPIEPGIVQQIIERERPDTLLPTMGGQTALNCALDLANNKVLEQFGVELIGASKAAIDKAENRRLFAEAMGNIGLETPRSYIASNLDEAYQAQADIGFPCIIRPSFTLGGTGGGIAYNKEEFTKICEQGLVASLNSELLIDESLIGWKEFELEVIRDQKDNCIIICSIENIDPMGVHTGDSIAVSPALTLTDKEYQRMRDAAIAVLREIGVETGGSNVQFAVHPDTGQMVVIEMNPRVSRSSALAAKATGFPIAKVAAKLAIGYTLDELSNDITKVTPASFEPSIDYVITKIPRFAFEKFPAADRKLTTQMKSVGEVMAIGRTFQESLQKALRSLELDLFGLESKVDLADPDLEQKLVYELSNPSADRIWYIGDAFRAGFSVERIYKLCHIDPWFLVQIRDLIEEEALLSQFNQPSDLSLDELRRLKRKGFSDHRMADLLAVSEQEVRTHRHALGLRPVYKKVDTCAAEFPTETAYLYSTYETICEANPSKRKKILTLGSGPNRIGQGVEFDYCCVHAAMAIREDGYESIIVNCNPETVSTDYDTSDRLFFEPITLEDVLEIVALEQPDGIIIQFGGQTPLKLAKALESNKSCKIIGTSADAIDRAEDRERFRALIDKLELQQPPNCIAYSTEEALEATARLKFPIVTRPSYVLGGRAMDIVYSREDLERYMHEAVRVSDKTPVLLDHFLDHATEVDVDLVSDGKDVVIGAIMEHIEQAGVHSGDSACVLPPHTLSADIQQKIRVQVARIALELQVIGLMNAQLAVTEDGLIYIIEVNPRASRSVPFVSKCIGRPLAKIAARVMTGVSLKQQGVTTESIPNYICVKESVFPFTKFSGVDPILGPEMKSTGEVMGVGSTFAEAFERATLASQEPLPDPGAGGKAFISVRDSDKPGAAKIAHKLLQLGMAIVATHGTADFLRKSGVKCQSVNKVIEGRPDISDLLKDGHISFIINTTEGRQAIADSAVIRKLALIHRVSYTTTLSGGEAMTEAMQYGPGQTVRRLQDLHAGITN